MIVWGLFLISALTFVWMFVGYPTTIWIVGKLWGRTVDRRPITPLVTVVVCTYNEAQTIARRISNLLASDYPHEQLEIIIVDSASPDGTADVAKSLVQEHPNRNIKLIQEQVRCGKVSAINLGLAAAAADVIILTDGPTIFARDTIKLVAQNFNDPSVGAVTGNFVKYDLEGEIASQETEWVVFGFRKWLRRLEALIDSTTWLSGELTAFRKTLVPNIPSDVIIDDAYLAMAIREQGYRVVVDERAVYMEKRPTRYSETVTIKVKSVVGSVQEMVRFRRMLFNLKFHFYGLLILPARLLHFYLNPFVFLSLLVSSTWLAFRYLEVVPILIGLGVLTTIGLFMRGYRKELLRPLTAFLLMQWIIVLGLWKYVTKSYGAVWEQVSTTRS